MTTGVSIFGDDEDEGDHDGSALEEAKDVRRNTLKRAIQQTRISGLNQRAWSDRKQEGLFGTFKNELKELQNAKTISTREFAEKMSSYEGANQVSGSSVRTWLNGVRNIPQKHTGTFLRAYRDLMREKDIL